MVAKNVLSDIIRRRSAGESFDIISARYGKTHGWAYNIYARHYESVVYENVRVWLEHNGMTIPALAFDMREDETDVRRWLSGADSVPLRFFDKLHRLTGMSYDKIMLRRE